MKELKRSKGLDVTTKYAVKLLRGGIKTAKVVGSVANLVLNPFAKVGLAYKGGKLLYKGAGLLGGAKTIVQGGRAITKMPNALRGVKNTQSYKNAEVARIKDMYQSSSFRTAARDIQSRFPSKFTQSGSDLKGLPAINTQKLVVKDATKQANTALLKERQVFTQIGRGIGSGVKTGVHTYGLIKGSNLLSGPQSPVKDSDALRKRKEKSDKLIEKQYKRLIN
tara:strand:+ start:82 stop:747 length:666 start_codon:yes stop_codon:yes gene_type:complete